MHACHHKQKLDADKLPSDSRWFHFAHLSPNIKRQQHVEEFAGT
jgi:hypothetical protein